MELSASLTVPSQSDITVEPFRASVALDTGEASIFYGPQRSHSSSWVSVDESWEVLVSVDGEVISSPKWETLIGC